MIAPPKTQKKSDFLLINQFDKRYGDDAEIEEMGETIFENLSRKMMEDVETRADAGAFYVVGKVQ